MAHEMTRKIFSRQSSGTFNAFCVDACMQNVAGDKRSKKTLHASKRRHVPMPPTPHADLDRNSSFREMKDLGQPHPHLSPPTFVSPAILERGGLSEKLLRQHMNNY